MSGAPPPWLVTQLERSLGGDPRLRRACRRRLAVVWEGLRAYTGQPLAHPLEWEDNVRPVLLQRWYRHWCHSTQPGPAEARWVRYTLNRLAATAGFHVRHASTPLRPAPRLHLCAVQERLVDALSPVGARERYCLRRFVAAFPLWCLPAVQPADVEWWLAHRRPDAVPAHGHGWFAAELRAAWARRPPSGLPLGTRRRVPLDMPEGPALATVPLGARLFFRHFFLHDEGAYVHRLRLSMVDLAPVHQTQLWDLVRELWGCLAETHPDRGGRWLDRVEDVQPLLREPTRLWDFLLQVYRRHGGGGGPRLPSSCAKALGAVVCVLREGGLDPGPFARAEYRRRIRMVQLQEEGCVPPPCSPPRRTYTPAECHALLRACDSHRDRLLLLLLQRTGLRNAALRRLTLADVLEPDAAGRPRPRQVAGGRAPVAPVRRGPRRPWRRAGWCAASTWTRWSPSAWGATWRTSCGPRCRPGPRRTRWPASCSPGATRAPRCASPRASCTSGSGGCARGRAWTGRTPPSTASGTSSSPP